MAFHDFNNCGAHDQQMAGLTITAPRAHNITLHFKVSTFVGPIGDRSEADRQASPIPHTHDVTVHPKTSKVCEAHRHWAHTHWALGEGLQADTTS